MATKRNFKKEAIEISKKFPFSPFPSAVSAANGQNETDGKVCGGLDPKFMELLDQGAHLDIDKVPL